VASRFVRQARVPAGVSGDAVEGGGTSGNLGSPSVLGALGIAINTISGGIACRFASCAAGDRIDVVQVSFAAGLRITDISLAVSGMSLSGSGVGGRFATVGGSLEAQTGILDNNFSADLVPTSLFAGAAA